MKKNKVQETKSISVSSRLTESEYQRLDSKRMFSETDSQLIRRLLHQILNESDFTVPLKKADKLIAEVSESVAA